MAQEIHLGNLIGSVRRGNSAMPKCKPRSILLNNYHSDAVSIFLCNPGKTGISQLAATDTIDDTGCNQTINDIRTALFSDLEQLNSFSSQLWLGGCID